MNQILSHRIGSALIPIGTGVDRLLCCQHFNKTATEMIKRISLPKMPMQTFGQELRQDVRPIQTTINAITNRDID